MEAAVDDRAAAIGLEELHGIVAARGARREVVLESLVSGDAVTTCTEVAVQHRIRAAAQVVADGDRLYD